MDQLVEARGVAKEGMVGERELQPYVPPSAERTNKQTNKQASEGANERTGDRRTRLYLILVCSNPHL